MRAGTIVVAGSLAQKPGYGGHTWVFLQYLLGFRRLGWDVLFVDRLEPEMCVNASGESVSLEHSWNAQYLRDVMKGFALDGSWSLLFDGGRRVLGLPRKTLLARMRGAPVVNVMGFLNDEELLAAASTKIFLDIDPGFPQMWQALDLAHPLRGHDRYVTIGENIGRPDCAIPTCGIEWITTVQPIVLEHWPRASDGRRTFTSVASWRGTQGPVEYGGVRYGLRAHEFRRFAAVPRVTNRGFEVALDIHPGDYADRKLLEANGWALVDPRSTAGDPWTYRRYVRSSAAEFSVAKSMYVQSRSGWFSDRSICYLASGRPVLAQDTGLRSIETGQGLVTFVSLDEAVEGVKTICANYTRHARAARELAEEWFDSDRVLTALLAKVGIA